MKLLTVMVAGLLLGTSSCKAQDDHFSMTKVLPKGLKEISGLARDGNTLWSISDDNKSAIYQLDLSGNVLQQFRIPGIRLDDVEAVSADRNYVYIGDIGDNDGQREARQIIRVPKSSIKNGSASGEVISFTFPDEGAVKKKKANNYDCEAMVVFHDSIYLFTKRREDGKSELYVLPDMPGTYAARSISVFKTKGLVTDAAVNANGTELALVGYDDGHTRPFIWIFSRFHGNDFFSGTHERYELTNQKKLDWQMESISYGDDHNFFLACEKTKDVTNTIYLIKRSQLIHSKKGESK